MNPELERKVEEVRQAWLKYSNGETVDPWIFFQVALTKVYEEAFELGRKEGSEEALANVVDWVKKRQEVWSDYYEDGE